MILTGNVPNGVDGVNGINGHSGENGHANGVDGHTNGVNGHTESQVKPSLRLSFAEYRRISNLLVLHLRKAEEGEAQVDVLMLSHNFITFCFINSS